MPKNVIDLSDKVLDLEFAYAGLVDFFKSSKSRTIRFFGTGEPTLEYQRMKEIWLMAKELAGDDLKVELETNGYFNDEVADWVSRHVDYLWISCDGWEEIQDRQRPHFHNKISSDKVFKNIEYFAKNQKIQLGIRATIEEENINKQSQLIDFFNKLGVKYVAASPTYHSKVNMKVKTPSLVNFAKHFVPAYKKAIELGMFYQTLLIVNFDEDVDFYCQASIPSPRLTTDGYVSSCDWASLGEKYLKNSIQKELIYGFFDKENKTIKYDADKIDKIRKRNMSFLSKGHCKDCRALKNCAGGCVGKMAAATDDLYKASEEWCAAVKYLFDNLPKQKQLFPFLHP